VDFQSKVINAQYIVNFFAKPGAGLALIRFYYLLWSELLQPYTIPPTRPPLNFLMIVYSLFIGLYFVTLNTIK